MREVFIVTTGSYSGYSIRAVFDERNLAEMFIKPRQGQLSRMDIEVFELNPKEVAIRDGWTVYKIEMRRDGSTDEGIEITPEDIKYVGEKALYESGRDGYFYLQSYVLAKDEQHAVKIVNEQRAQVIALGEWPEDGEPLPPPTTISKRRFGGAFGPGLAEGIT